ncbi:hypothetical protein CRUP_014148 [Coryphaenoides rupestris]|nr:hypothetical protein CRUP_014148 [Coryphaenoides rupestris]
MMTVNMDEGLQTGPGQHRNTQDDEEALNSIMKDLAALGRCYAQHNSHKPKSRTLLYKQDLRVKLEHEREKRCLTALFTCPDMVPRERNSRNNTQP